MGLLDKVKAGAEQAASTAQKAGADRRHQARASQAYSDLGRTRSAWSIAARSRTATSRPASITSASCSRG